MLISECSVGQRIYFGRRNGEKTLGEIVKVNRKTVKVKQVESRGTRRDYKVGSLWTVPVGLCTAADKGRPARVPEKRRAKRPCLVDILTGKRTYGRPGESEDSLFGRMANGLH